MISQTYFATVPFTISRKVFIGYKQKLIDNIFGFQYQRARRGCDVIPTLDRSEVHGHHRQLSVLVRTRRNCIAQAITKRPLS